MALLPLTNGIYPSRKVLAKTTSSPGTKEEFRYSKRQEGACNFVEHLFGMLFKRFDILSQPGRPCKSDDMATVLLACVFVYNMIGEERRDSYNTDGAGGERWDEPEGGEWKTEESVVSGTSLMPISQAGHEDFLQNERAWEMCRTARIAV